MKKILLVDDEVDILEFLKYNLEQDNFEVLISTNGKDALKKISQNPDLIVLDIMMPEMDGFELYQQIKTNKEYQEICDTSERTASRDLAELVSLKIFEQIDSFFSKTFIALAPKNKPTMQSPQRHGEHREVHREKKISPLAGNRQG